MPISDPDDRFFYPHHIPIEDTYIVVLVPTLFYAVKFIEYLTAPVVQLSTTGNHIVTALVAGFQFYDQNC